jgi:hypothetical protein
MVTLLFKFYWSTSSYCSSSLVTIRCLPCSGWYAKTYVSDLELSTTPMLFSLCWSSPYALTMLVKDFRLFFSQFGSFDMLKEFCLWIWKIGLWIQTLPFEFDKLILVGIKCAWIWRKLEILINVYLLFLHWILINPNPCSWSVVCYLTWPLHPITMVILILMCTPIAYDQTLIPAPNLGLV